MGLGIETFCLWDGRDRAMPVSCFRISLQSFESVRYAALTHQHPLGDCPRTLADDSLARAFAFLTIGGVEFDSKIRSAASPDDG